MTSPATYWRTVRYLKPGQITGRIAFRWRRPHADLRPAPPLRPRSGPWLPPGRRLQSVHAPMTFDLLNERHALAEVGWDGPEVARLWRYHQHYFDDLHAVGAERRERLHAELIARWMADNPVGHGPGWEPYPLSLRIVRWIQWLLAGHAPPAGMLDSLAAQTRWLAQRLETHLLGNHLFANVKALVFAGLFFTGDEAALWLRDGSRILGRELGEQILADGGQFERSPMYHALALEDVLDLVDLIDALGAGVDEAVALRAELARRVPAMARWLRAMTHPDGTLGRFNDCADGIAPANDELFRLAAGLGFDLAEREQGERGVIALADSGYLRVEHGPAVALLDIAPVGPDYLPGHAHADTLSFELSLRGRRIVVNGGTSCYGDGPERARERATAAHSTVEVAGESSSEVWAGFRVGRRARPEPPSIERKGDGIVIASAHDGYAHLRCRPLHRRTWRFEADALVIDDTVADTHATAVARYHLAPGLTVAAIGDAHWRVSDGEAPLANIEIVAGSARADASFHAPQFGIVEATRCLAVALEGGRATTRWTWLG